MDAFGFGFGFVCCDPKYGPTGKARNGGGTCVGTQSCQTSQTVLSKQLNCVVPIDSKETRDHDPSLPRVKAKKKDHQTNV